MSAHGYTVEIIKDPETFESLQPDWNGLFQRADRPYLSQSFEWSWCVWETITKPRGGRLHCILIRKSGRLVLIWPLAILSYHRLWRAARSLSMTGDYTDVLVEASPQARPLADLAWRTLQKSCGMDLIVAELVRTDSLLHQVLLTQKAGVTEADRAFYVAWEDFEDWNIYQSGLSGRQPMDRRFRRLQECGHVAFELVQEPQRQHELMAWLLQRKLERLAQQGIAPVWGDDAKPFQDFLTQASREVSRFGKLLVFALTLENEPLAVQIVIRDAFRMRAFHIAHEPKWSKYGPGNLVLRHCLHWAFERRLPVDLLPGDFAYKKVFGNGEVEVATRFYATNAWGHLSLRLRAWQRHLKARRSARQELVPKPVTST
jgi:CelD/BcsL family acetyltransferase involved in cellulose biosynthesis